ncbi:MAG: acylphosphatase [Ignavibacteriales bacterium]|nr:acylphosphatase [Ignavibacteriales bacterium]
MSEMARAEINVWGNVQGVGFRYFTTQHAKRLGVRGYVQNVPGGDRVRAVVEGNESRIEDLYAEMRRGPASGSVERHDIAWGAPTGEFDGFNVR